MPNQNFIQDFEEKTKDLNVPTELFINVVMVDGYLRDDQRKRLGA